MKKVLLENEEVTIELEEGIILTNWKITSADLNLAQRAVKYRLQCTNYVAYPILSNIRSVKSSTKAARDFLASEGGCEGAIAAAVLIDSLIGSMMGNFFINISKPLVPTKLFTNEDEAKKWLAKFVIDDIKNAVESDDLNVATENHSLKGGLSEREIEIIILICKEYTNIEIGTQLSLSTRTVEAHRKSILIKTGAKNTAGIVMYAVKHNLCL